MHGAAHNGYRSLIARLEQSREVPSFEGPQARKLDANVDETAAGGLVAVLGVPLARLLPLLLLRLAASVAPRRRPYARDALDARVAVDRVDRKRHCSASSNAAARLTVAARSSARISWRQTVTPTYQPTM